MPNEPTRRWGTYRGVKHKCVDVCPCDERGMALHDLGRDCPCQPRIEQPYSWSDWVLVIHRHES